MSVCTKGDAKSSCKTKVGNLNLTITANKQILRFEIAVKNSSAVTKLDSNKDLLQIALK